MNKITINSEDIKKVKEIAERNYIESAETSDKGMPHFMFDEVKIINPWMSECGRFELSDKEAIDKYGLKNVLDFIIKILGNQKEGN